jgi:hypothetical protein
MTLQVSGLRLGSHAAAVEFLKTIGATFLFEVDRSRAYLLEPQRLPVVSWSSGTATDVVVGVQPDLRFPSGIVQGEPLETFVRARGFPESLPLEKYLAFYHVIEYFFGQYSAGRAERTDKSDLRRVLEHCVAHDELRDFVTSTRVGRSGLAEELVRQGEPFRLTPIDPDGVNLLDDVATRVTDLRNGIAHSKEPRPGRLFLKRDLSHAAISADLALVQFIASSVLSAPASRRDARSS